MGGLISIYGLAEYPEVFGNAACLSTHWTGAIGDNQDFPTAMKYYLMDRLPRGTDHRLYFDNGDCPYDSQYLPAYEMMNRLFDFLGYQEGVRLKTRVFQLYDMKSNELFVNELKSYRNDDLSKGQANSIQGANIIAKTINLADSWQNIEKDLIEFLHKLETPFLGPIKV